MSKQPSAEGRGLPMGESSLVVLMLMAVALTYVIATYESVDYQFMSDLHLIGLNFATLLLVFILPMITAFWQLFHFQGNRIPFRRIGSMFFVGNAFVLFGALAMATYGYNAIPAAWLLNHIFFTFYWIPGIAIQSLVVINLTMILGVGLLVVMSGDQTRVVKMKKK